MAFRLKINNNTILLREEGDETFTNILPTSPDYFDIGTSSEKFKNIYCNTLWPSFIDGSSVWVKTDDFYWSRNNASYGFVTNVTTSVTSMDLNNGSPTSSNSVIRFNKATSSGNQSLQICYGYFVKAAGDNSTKTVTFKKSFNVAPMVITQEGTYNAPGNLTYRNAQLVGSITNTGFTLQSSCSEQSKVGYIAVGTSIGI